MPTLADARLRACKLWPYGSHAILSLVPVPKAGLGTLAVDQHWRLYFDEQALSDRPLDESAGVILHEVSHLMLKHFRRAERIVPDNATQEQWDRWNTATDYAINSMLREQGIQLWDGVLYPEQDGFSPALTGEEYYRLLTDKANERSDAVQDENEQSTTGDNSDETGNETSNNGQSDPPADGGTGSDADNCGNEGSEPAGTEGCSDGHVDQSAAPAGQPVCGDGGSCADGRQRPWELPKDSEVPAIKPHEADILASEVAQRILDKQQGDGTGAWERWASEILSPRVDPRIALLRLVRHAVEATSGQGDYSYRRPNRRNPSRDILRPSAVQPIPRITIIVDTSGSMDERDLGLSLGLIGKVLNGFRIRDGIKVVCGDTQAVVAAKVFDPKQVTLAGGGGTDMGTLIRQAADGKPKPQLIVVCTDGVTPWCEPVGIPVVACLTQQTSNRVPAWIKTVTLN